MALLTSAQILLFNASFTDEEIRGEPKIVRIERQDHVVDSDRERTNSTQYLQDATEYLPGRRKAERRVYLPDGALSRRELYEYGDDGLTKIRTYGRTGAEQGTRSIRAHEDGTEETVLVNGEGKELERTITKRDGAGRILESTSIDLPQNTEIHLGLRYDNQGRLTEGQITSKPTDGIALRVEIAHQEDKDVISCYTSDGMLLSRGDRRVRDSGESSMVVFNQSNSPRKTIERIDLRDANGNWTKKTILERKQSTQTDEPVASLHRDITYY